MRPKYNRKVVSLSPGTASLLARGARYWSGPGHVTSDMAALLGLADQYVPDVYLADMASRLERGKALSVLDLTRVLWLTETGMVSAVLGPGDWENVYGAGNYAAFQGSELELLREAQDELAQLGVPASGTDPFGTRT